ncbi:7388_t:CDS:2 [Dentiscutata erythropus]|uniref:7388_t:CDS:1 n=1 Tax=Dentiscutata erythropus TaxID=1348616 RepID=A0A9N9JXZ8_9GLOM|nr:7388_t:CDS:2 [Dentiscutata erythropus]
MDQAQFNTLVQALTGLTAQLNNNTPAPAPTLPVTISLFYGPIVEDITRIRYAATGMKDAAASW